jgi:serpin B
MHLLAARQLAVTAFAAGALCGCDSTPRPAPETPASASSSAPAAAGSDARPPQAPPSPGEARSFAQASNAFGFDLHARLREKPGNLTYSPASITLALAMTWGGAAGPTSDEMRATLHFQGPVKDVLASAGKLSATLQDPKRPVVLAIANRLFGEKTYGFEKPFLDDTATLFGAPLEPVDFRTQKEAARQRINGWVAERTRDRIKDLVPASGVSTDTRLALVNAVYFLGDWEEPFQKTATGDQPFLVNGTKETPVPTMRKVHGYEVADAGDATVVQLPYKGGELAMLVVVPKKADGLGEIEAKLDAKRLDGWVSALKSERVALAMPRFEVNPAESIALRDELEAMGMKLAFDADRADFTKIANPPSKADRLVISQVFHKAFVKVDEKGTEAAAATAVMMARGGGAPEQPRQVKVDRPFLFFLRDIPSGLVLFAGRVVDPTQKG